MKKLILWSFLLCVGLAIVYAAWPATKPGQAAREQPSGPDQGPKDAKPPAVRDAAFDAVDLDRTREWFYEMIEPLWLAQSNAIDAERINGRIRDEFDKLKGAEVEWVVRVSAIKAAEKGMAELSLLDLEHELKGRAAVSWSGSQPSSFVVPPHERLADLRRGDRVRVRAKISSLIWQHRTDDQGWHYAYVNIALAWVAID